MIRLLPFAMASILYTARTRILPRPVLYASSMPAFPRMVAPVGKSGPFTISISSSMVVGRSFLHPVVYDLDNGSNHLTQVVRRNIRCHTNGISRCRHLPEYWENEPEEPSVLFSVSSKFGIKSTVFLPISASISMEIRLSLASVSHRCGTHHRPWNRSFHVHLQAGNGSPISEPYLPTHHRLNCHHAGGIYPLYHRRYGLTLRWGLSGPLFSSTMEYRTRLCTGFKPSRTSGSARAAITLIA